MRPFRCRLQVEGPQAYAQLIAKVRSGGAGVLYEGALANMAASFVGGYPFWLSFNYLSRAFPTAGADTSAARQTSGLQVQTSESAQVAERRPPPSTHTNRTPTQRSRSHASTNPLSLRRREVLSRQSSCAARPSASSRLPHPAESYRGRHTPHASLPVGCESRGQAPPRRG